jgi:hypothetical protein
MRWHSRRLDRVRVGAGQTLETVRGRSLASIVVVDDDGHGVHFAHSIHGSGIRADEAHSVIA